MSEKSKWELLVLNCDGHPLVGAANDEDLQSVMDGNPVPRMVWIAMRVILSAAMRHGHKVAIECHGAEVRILINSPWNAPELILCYPYPVGGVAGLQPSTSSDVDDEELGYNLYERTVEQSEFPKLNLRSLGYPCDEEDPLRLVREHIAFGESAGLDKSKHWAAVQAEILREFDHYRREAVKAEMDRKMDEEDPPADTWEGRDAEFNDMVKGWTDEDKPSKPGPDAGGEASK
jgi:hypothetical protein